MQGYWEPGEVCFGVLVRGRSLISAVLLYSNLEDYKGQRNDGIILLLILQINLLRQYWNIQ